MWERRKIGEPGKFGNAHWGLPRSCDSVIESVVASASINVEPDRAAQGDGLSFRERELPQRFWSLPGWPQPAIRTAFWQFCFGPA